MGNGSVGCGYQMTLSKGLWIFLVILRKKKNEKQLCHHKIEQARAPSRVTEPSAKPPILSEVFCLGGGGAHGYGDI